MVPYPTPESHILLFSWSYVITSILYFQSLKQLCLGCQKKSFLDIPFPLHFVFIPLCLPFNFADVATTFNFSSSITIAVLLPYHLTSVFELYSFTVFERSSFLLHQSKRRSCLNNFILSFILFLHFGCWGFANLILKPSFFTFIKPATFNNKLGRRCFQLQ